MSKIEDEGLDIERIKNANKDSQKTQYGKTYNEKDHHGPWRKKFIRYQNHYLADMPMSILGILCLFFIPVFNYIQQIKKMGIETGDED